MFNTKKEAFPMTPDVMTYAQLDKVLKGLGFTRERVEPKWIRYYHKPTDLTIGLVEKKPTEIVRPTEALSARLHLVQTGLVSDEELDALLKPKTPPKRR
jgi:hypothetical protein